MNIKGTAVRSRLDFIRQSYGAAAVETAFSPFRNRERHLIEGALPITWVPLELVDRLDVELVRLAGGRQDVAREYGAFSARRNLTHVYKIFVDQALGDPHALLEGLTPLHASFYDEGEMRASDTRPGCGRAEIDFAGQASHFRCQVAAGFVEASLRMLDVSELVVTQRDCQLDGAELCSIEARWLPQPIATRLAPRQRTPLTAPGA